MKVFRYDRSFEGLLTALFDVYVRRTFPEALIGEGEPVPMFATEVFEVYTDSGKAARVWTGLQKRVSREVCNMLMYVWFSEEKGSDLLLMRYLRKVFDSKDGVVSDFTDGDMLQARQIARRVAKERERLLQFVRFQKAADGTFYAPVSPACNALPLAIGHFRDRFADQKWLIYDLKRRYGYYYDLETVTEVSLTDVDTLPGIRLDDRLMAGDEKLFQRLWKGYFDAMTIRERVNPRLQRQMMPKRYWRFLTEKQ